jgi:predicted MFS family arabinose efflux permease
MSAAFGITFLPFLLLSVPAGIFADRYASKLILVLCDFLSFFLLLVLGALALTNSNLVLIFCILFVYSCIAPFHYPAFHTAMRRSVPAEQLSVWIGRATSIEQTSTVLTPAFGGILAVSLDPAIFLFFNASALAFSGYLIARFYRDLSVVHATMDTKVNFRQDMRVCLQVLSVRPLLLLGSAGLALANFSSTLLQASITFAILDTLSLTSFHLGIFLSLCGVGGIIGSLVASTVIEKFGVVRVMQVTSVLSVFLIIPMYNGSFIVLTSCWAVASCVGSVSAVAFYTYRQLAVDASSVGKVISITRLITLSAIPPAAFISGPLLERGGIAGIVALMFVARLLAAAVITYGSKREVRNFFY